MTFIPRFTQFSIGDHVYNYWIFENLVDRILDEDGRSNIKEDIVTVWYEIGKLETRPWNQVTGMLIRTRNHGSLCYWLVRGYNHTDVQGEIFSFGPHPGGDEVDAAFRIVEGASANKHDSRDSYTIFSEALDAGVSAAKRAAKSALEHAVNITTFEDVEGFLAPRL